MIEGEATLRALYKGYGDIPPFGRGPDQQKIHNQGNAYVRRNFPKTDFIQSCELVYLPREPEQIVTKPAADAEIAAEIAEELSLAESTSESTLAAASSNSEEIPEVSHIILLRSDSIDINNIPYDHLSVYLSVCVFVPHNDRQF